jgi:signal transduction histidine kinase
VTRPASSLEILNPDGSIGSAILDRTPFTIGSAAAADLRLAARWIGPRQAQIVRFGGRHHLVPDAPAGEDRLVALMDIARTITASLDLGDALARVLDGAVRFSGAERGYLFLKGPDGLVPWSADGSPPPNVEVSRTAAEEVARSGRPLYRDRIGDEGAGSVTASVVRLRLQAILCLPLACRGEIIGVVYLDSRRALPHHRPDLPLLEALAGLAAVAIQNSRLVAERLRAERTLAFGQMARGIVHDLRSPLGSIRGLADLLLERAAASDSSRPHLQTIIGEVDRLTGLTGDLLQVSRDAPPLRRQAQAVTDLVRRTLAPLQTGLRRRGVTLDLDLDPSARLAADGARMVRVLHNLVGNALDAMPLGGTLTIACRPQGSLCRLTVRDTGRGMSEEVRARAFEPFFSHGKSGGTGLGMAIVRTIVEEHGGTVRLQSAPGRGTTVTLDLPAAPSSSGVEGSPGESQADATGSTAN